MWGNVYVYKIHAYKGEKKIILNPTISFFRIVFFLFI